MRYLLRFALLCVAAGLTSFGLAYWQHTGFTMEGFWFVDNDYRPHPLHILALGLAMIPTTIWEIFLLDARRGDAKRDGNAPHPAPSVPPDAQPPSPITRQPPPVADARGRR